MTITNNKRQFRFEIDKEGFDDPATLDYRWLKGSMVLMKTWVPLNLRGAGLGKKLAIHALEHARTHRLKIIVYCPFIELFIKNHPEYEELLDATRGR
jgi:uncharacterized protein